MVDNGQINQVVLIMLLFTLECRIQTPDEICADQAVNFIENYEENKPFLLTVGFARPHSPYYAPAKFFEHLMLYQGDFIS